MRIGMGRSNTLWGAWDRGDGWVDRDCQFVTNCVHKTFVNSTVNAATDSLLDAFIEYALLTACTTPLFVFLKDKTV